MGSSLPRLALALASGVAVFATGPGLVGRWDRVGALVGLGAATVAGGLVWWATARHRRLRPGPRASPAAFLLRAAGWTIAAFAVLAPLLGLIGRRIVLDTWPDPDHSQAGLFVLVFALWYGAAWAPVAGVLLAWRTARVREEAA